MSTESLKFPRIFHLPFSPGATSDDKMLVSVDHFLNVPVVLTEKLDGSNLCLTREAIYSRSHQGAPTHESFDYAKQFHAGIRHQIPDNLSIFGEYLWAVHSIAYSDLPGYFLIFGVREDLTGKWWSWEMVKEMARELGVPTVPELGTFTRIPTEASLQKIVEAILLVKKTQGGDPCEGIVIRVAGEFMDFPMSEAKFVRKNHVTSDQHWQQKEVERNKLRG